MDQNEAFKDFKDFHREAFYRLKFRVVNSKLMIGPLSLQHLIIGALLILLVLPYIVGNDFMSANVMQSTISDFRKEIHGIEKEMYKTCRTQI